MKKYEAIINKHFESFIESRKKYSEVRIAYQKWLFKMEYQTHFIDEFDATGFIYYKPAFGRYGRLYMFKGKPFNSKPYPRIAFFNIGGHVSAMLKNAGQNPDRKKKSKAEWRVFFHFWTNLIKAGLISLSIGIPAMMIMMKK